MATDVKGKLERNDYIVISVGVVCVMDVSWGRDGVRIQISGLHPKKV
jgi:hypothetical protein